MTTGISSEVISCDRPFHATMVHQQEMPTDCCSRVWGDRGQSTLCCDLAAFVLKGLLLFDLNSSHCTQRITEAFSPDYLSPCCDQGHLLHLLSERGQSTRMATRTPCLSCDSSFLKTLAISDRSSVLTHNKERCRTKKRQRRVYTLHMW